MRDLIEEIDEDPDDRLLACEGPHSARALERRGRAPGGNSGIVPNPRNIRVASGGSTYAVLKSGSSSWPVPGAA